MSSSPTESTSSKPAFLANVVSPDTSVSVRFNSEEEAPRFAVGYWSIRGLGAPLRMMLSAAKINHDVYLYDIVEDGDNGWNSSYFQTKESLKTESKNALVNLPFVVDRKECRLLCQTNACFAHIGRCIGMFGTNDVEASICEQLLCEIYDLRYPYIIFCYRSDGSVEEAKKAFAQAEPHLQKLNSHLANEANNGGDDDKKVHHLVGGVLNAPDFHLFELLDQFQFIAQTYGISDDFLGQYPRLKEFKTGFEELEENQFYLKSWLHEGLPFNNCMSKAGSALNVGVFQRGQKAEWRGKGEISMNP
uniref:glutathione transferase n=1 Tax=Ditylum brightwellii TaxID=49249 RepID=A0A7S4QZQ0_9STRA